jgi:phage tail-like protein
MNPLLPDQTLLAMPAFRFEVSLRQTGSSGGAALCRGAFSECTGLEATMEPKVIKVGGSNYGALQRAGSVSFATVVLKRGLTRSRDLFQWFQFFAGGHYAGRLSAEIEVRDAAGQPVLTWGLERCMPVKFKAADLNARGSDVGIEELHLVHEGLRLYQTAPDSGGAP